MFLVQRSPASRCLRLIVHLPDCSLLQGSELFPLLLSLSSPVILYNHIFPAERGQYLDYALGFLKVSCMVVVMILVTLLENFQGFQFAHSLLAFSLFTQSLLEYSLLAHLQLAPFHLAHFPQD